MSKHQPAGQPIGGQFAVDEKLENGTALPVPGIPDGHRGSCYHCSDGVALVGGNVTHTGLDGAPVAGGPGRHEPEFDPWQYEGDDVDAIAQAEAWGGSMWEKYEDGRDERNRQDDSAVAEQRGRESVTGGVDMSGTTEQIRDSAQKASWQAEVLYQVAGAKACAEEILAAYPDAAVLELEDNDQEGSAFVATRILDAGGEHIADFEEFEDHWAAMTDLPARPPRTTVFAADGSTSDEPDPRFAFLELEGSRRMGYTGKLHLAAAAAMDLTALLS